jgi:hypothetical protein
VLLVSGLAVAVALVIRFTSPERVAAAACSLSPEDGVSGVGRLIFTSVAASRADDVWVVGTQYGHGPTGGAVLQHWNGSSWSNRSPSGPNVELQDVTARSSADAWAVGAIGGSVFIERWDGTEWSPTPAHVGGPAIEEELLGVSANTGDDAWAVG